MMYCVDCQYIFSKDDALMVRVTGDIKKSCCPICGSDDIKKEGRKN